MFAHGGMPNFYDGLTDNRSDYLVNWDVSQTDVYRKIGFDPRKLYTSGDPSYQNKPERLEFSLDNIVVLTKSLNGVCPLEKQNLEDRGNAILYLESISKVLKNIVASHVRLRPHPSENPNWYLKFLDKRFFKIETKPLKESFKDSTLVIGPTSTTIIDAMAHEVNYLIYESLIGKKMLLGHEITPPLDGSDKRLPIARSENELNDIILKKRKIDISCYEDYAPPFNIDFLKDLI